MLSTFFRHQALSLLFEIQVLQVFSNISYTGRSIKIYIFKYLRKLATFLPGPHGDGIPAAVRQIFHQENQDTENNSNIRLSVVHD